MSGKVLALRAEVALGAFLAQASLWPEDRKVIEAAMSVLRKAAS